MSDFNIELHIIKIFVLIKDLILLYDQLRLKD